MELKKAVYLLPILIFLVIFIGCGVLLGDFYAVPAIVAFLIALIVAFIQSPARNFEQKLKVVASEVGNENIITMCFIFLAAGAFSHSVNACGGVDSIVNLCLGIIPSDYAVAGVFLIACILSLSMGTSMGTIAALTPITVGIAQKAGISLPLCMGATVSGAMFGDNLSVISDTTIAAVKTQGCKMNDKFKENFFIVLPAAIISVAIFIFADKGGKVPADIGNYSIISVIPYIIVLGGALAGFNVFGVLIAGTLSSLAIGVFNGSIALNNIFAIVGDGVVSMYDITVISITVAAMVGLIKYAGGIDFILKALTGRTNSSKGAQFGIAGLSLLVDACTANNTVAIVMTGPIAKEISGKASISPRRSASLLDIFSSVGQGLIPYGSQLLSAANLSGVTPFDIIPYMCYPILMAISAILFILLKKDNKKAV